MRTAQERNNLQDLLVQCIECGPDTDPLVDWRQRNAQLFESETSNTTENNEIICRGQFHLNTACGKCRRCVEEMKTSNERICTNAADAYNRFEDIFFAAQAFLVASGVNINDDDVVGELKKLTAKTEHATNPPRDASSPLPDDHTEL